MSKPEVDTLPKLGVGKNPNQQKRVNYPERQVRDDVRFPSVKPTSASEQKRPGSAVKQIPGSTNDTPNQRSRPNSAIAGNMLDERRLLNANKPESAKGVRPRSGNPNNHLSPLPQNSSIGEEAKKIGEEAKKIAKAAYVRIYRKEEVTVDQLIKEEVIIGYSEPRVSPLASARYSQNPQDDEEKKNWSDLYLKYKKYKELKSSISRKPSPDGDKFHTNNSDQDINKELDYFYTKIHEIFRGKFNLPEKLFIPKRDIVAACLLASNDIDEGTSERASILKNFAPLLLNYGCSRRAIEKLFNNTSSGSEGNDITYSLKNNITQIKSAYSKAASKTGLFAIRQSDTGGEDLTKSTTKIKNLIQLKEYRTDIIDKFEGCNVGFQIDKNLNEDEEIAANFARVAEIRFEKVKEFDPSELKQKIAKIFWQLMNGEVSLEAAQQDYSNLLQQPCLNGNETFKTEDLFRALTLYSDGKDKDIKLTKLLSFQKLFFSYGSRVAFSQEELTQTIGSEDFFIYILGGLPSQKEQIVKPSIFDFSQNPKLEQFWRQKIETGYNDEEIKNRLERVQEIIADLAGVELKKKVEKETVTIDPSRLQDIFGDNINVVDESAKVVDNPKNEVSGVVEELKATPEGFKKAEQKTTNRSAAGSGNEKVKKEKSLSEKLSSKFSKDDSLFNEKLLNLALASLLDLSYKEESKENKKFKDFLHVKKSVMQFFVKTVFPLLKKEGDEAKAFLDSNKDSMERYGFILDKLLDPKYPLLDACVVRLRLQDQDNENNSSLKSSLTKLKNHEAISDQEKFLISSAIGNVGYEQMSKYFSANNSNSNTDDHSKVFRRVFENGNLSGGNTRIGWGNAQEEREMFSFNINSFLGERMDEVEVKPSTITCSRTNSAKLLSEVGAEKNDLQSSK